MFHDARDQDFCSEAKPVSLCSCNVIYLFIIIIITNTHIEWGEWLQDLSQDLQTHFWMLHDMRDRDICSEAKPVRLVVVEYMF